MKRLIFTVLFLVSIAGRAELSMQVDVAKVTLGQSFRAVLTKDDASPSSIPDLTPLQTDFNIVGTERSTNYSIINGHASSTSQWTLLLMPKRAGVLTIPPIHLGQEQTQALRIEVVQANTPTSTNDSVVTQKDVMLITDVSNPNPYVNEQVIYTVKLYNSKRLLDATYQGPVVSDALLIPLGDVRRYQATENGLVYLVEEQRYAIFPQKSGELKISAPEFNALVYRAVPEQVNVTAPSTILKVKPAPANYKGNTWAPAKQMILNDEYDRNVGSLTEGSTLVRTITLQATGLPAQLLPALPIAKGAGFSIYSEKPVESNRLNQNELTGTRTVKVTYLFNKAGDVVIPAEKLYWFNTVTQVEETTSLPELAITVLPNASATQPASDKTEPPVEKPVVLKQAVPESPVVLPVPGDSNALAWWLAGGFALAWLVTLLLWWQRPRLFSKAGKKRVLKQLEEACVANQPELARTALLHWAKQQWPDATLSNLNDIHTLCHDTELKKQINELSKALYQSSPLPWHGDPLWRCVVAFKKPSSGKTGKDAPLPPINPV